MKAILSTFILCLSASINSFAQDTTQHLQYNNVHAAISNVGSFFTNLATSTGGYEVPNGSGVNAMYSASFWFSAEDAGGNLFTSIGGHPSTGTDVDRGPFSSTNAYGDPDYDKAFMLTICQEEIDNFILWWQCENGISSPGCSSVMQPSAETLNTIYTWPGNGENSLGQAAILAPFFDQNSDGIYDPIVGGDYPLIKGCCATYMIQNDVGNVHTQSGTDPIGLEMHYMFYHFGANSFLYNTTFVDVMAINKSQTNYVDFNHSFYLDADLGNPLDDYIGSDSTNNLLMFYNGDNNDEPFAGLNTYNADPPALGITALALPASSAIPYITSANTPAEYTNIMKGVQVSGAPWLDPNGSPTKFVYSGNPNTAGAWNETSVGNIPDDRRGLLSTNYGSFNAGDTARQTYAIVYSRIGNNLENAAHLSALASEAKAFYDNGDTDCDAGGFVSTPELEKDDISVYPNPNNGTFHIINSQDQLKSIQIFDVTGQEVPFYKQQSGSEWTVSISGVRTGIYLLRLETTKGVHTQRIVIDNK